VKCLRFSLWGFQSATESAIRFQVAKSRQLIADALIQRNRSTREFLEDAVQDLQIQGPLSHSAPSSSYDVFWWRAVVWRTKPHRPALRPRRISKGPFALKGFWFESFQDMKRATGCYSKAFS
jgi:hypothetical protein